MARVAREEALTETFVDLADTLVSDYDVVSLLDLLVSRCVKLLDVDAAGLLLSDQRGGLRVIATSAEQARSLELFQVQSNEGPCLDCFARSRPVLVDDLAAADDRWPRFAPAARGSGYRAVSALPLRLRDDTIGALNLFRTQPGRMPLNDQRVAQAMADVATIGILQERAIHRQEVVVEQLQGALNSRVVIEQAKGLLAERGRVDMDAAFTALRSFARGRGLNLVQVATRLVLGHLDPDAVLLQGRQQGRQQAADGRA